jgi:hypothetical protein
VERPDVDSITVPSMIDKGIGIAKRISFLFNTFDLMSTLSI